MSSACQALSKRDILLPNIINRLESVVSSFSSKENDSCRRLSRLLSHLKEPDALVKQEIVLQFCKTRKVESLSILDLENLALRVIELADFKVKTSEPILQKRQLEQIDFNLDFPVELICHVFSFLNNPSSARLTCKRWNQIIFHDPYLCSRLFLRAFGCMPNLTIGTVQTQFQNVIKNVEKQTPFKTSPKSKLFSFEAKESVNYTIPLFNGRVNFTMDSTISLLAENRLLICDSNDQINFQIWDLVQNPPVLIESLSVDKNIKSMMTLTILCDASYLLNTKEIITVLKDNGAECVIYDLNCNYSFVLFKVANKNSSPSCLDVKQMDSDKWIAIGFKDGNCEIWSLDNCKKVATAKFAYPVTAICLDAKRDRLIVGFEDGIVKVLDMKKLQEQACKPTKSYKISTTAIAHLCVQGNILATGTKSGQDKIDEITLMPIHSDTNKKTFLISQLEGLAFQETELVAVYGNPLRMKKFDLSNSEQDSTGQNDT